MLTELTTLLSRHAALLRAELAAIARDLLLLVMGGAVVASLVIGAFIVSVGALIIGLGVALYGSPLFGVAVLVAVLLSLAAWIPVVLLHPARGRVQRRRAILPALAAVLLTAPVAVVAGLPAESGSGVATLAGIVTFGISLLLSLRALDRDALADRFYPHVSEAELRATLAAADALRGGRNDGDDD